MIFGHLILKSAHLLRLNEARNYASQLSIGVVSISPNIKPNLFMIIVKYL